MVFACFSLGLLHVNEAGSFECQTCWGGYGNTKEMALKACNHSIEMVVCDEEKPVCMVHHADHDSFHLISRGCASKDSVEENNRLCKDTTILDGYECTVAMCEESGCTAELPKSVTRCPTCQSTTSLQDCDQKSKLQTCSPRWLGDTDKMRCSVYEDESGGFFRGCMGPIGYKRLKGSLKQFGVCKGDECVASFRGVFRCPACLSKTSLEDCDSNSQLQHCDPLILKCALCMKKAVAILDENAWTLRHMDGSTMAVGSSGLDTARRMTVSQALKSKMTTGD